jgi:hypothetical protein
LLAKTLFDRAAEFFRIHTQIVGIAVAALVLIVIFIPLQDQQASKGANDPSMCGLIGGHNYGPCPTPQPPRPRPAGGGSTTVIVNNKASVITKNVINNIILKAQNIKVVASPSAKGPLSKLKTIELGKSTFSSNAIRPLAVVTPFKIIGGHALLTSVSKNLKLVAATITNKGLEHAVIIDLTKTRDLRAGEAVYSTNLGEVISGTNPFTKLHDTVTNFTDLLLWNNSNSPVVFGDDDLIAMMMIFR